MNKKVTSEIEKFIIDQYLLGLSTYQIAKILFISTDTIRMHLIKNNIKLRNLSESHKVKFNSENSISWKVEEK